eukprot:14193641-Alexandrium_andersonii.AAC.1
MTDDQLSVHAGHTQCVQHGAPSSEHVDGTVRAHACSSSGPLPPAPAGSLAASLVEARGERPADSSE